MTGIQVVPMDQAVAKEVRSTLLAPGYGHPAWNDDIEGTAPCRLCLTMIKPGEERMILFTYDAFHGREDIPLPGPVFVHERDCTPYDGESFPEQFVRQSLVLDAYRDGRQLVLETRVDGTEAAAELSDLLARPEIDYIHVRSAKAGCYLFTVQPG
ncbi:DUF1203 domain-containing protein [Amycolatopsis sp.]|uniref:DUF1203 domain-containing protein n=1 Tax=Amycolatopsis sp. TaxID=37632 RepID=UPI002DFDBFEC|nr:DUF1203 domain-containing protein [Amycolatopsis sp.]